MEKVNGNISVSIYVTCPKCEEYLDLFDSRDVGDYLNEEGGLWKIIQSTDYDSWKDLGVEVECQHCKESFVFDEMEY